MPKRKKFPCKKFSQRKEDILNRGNPNVSSMKVVEYLSDSIPPEEKERIIKLKRKIVHRK